jgi:hypothetical protein
MMISAAQAGILLGAGLNLLARMLWMALPAGATGEKSPVAVLIGASAPPLEQYAAEQLCGYLEKLFHLRVQPMRVGTGRLAIPASARPFSSSAARQPTPSGQGPRKASPFRPSPIKGSSCAERSSGHAPPC